MSDKPRTQKELWEVKWVIAARARGERRGIDIVLLPESFGDGWFRWNHSVFDEPPDLSLKFCRATWGDWFEFRSEKTCH